MADIFTKEKRSEVMSKVKSKHSKIEKRVAALLRKSDIRYRRHSARLPGKPDFYFLNRKTVLFVDSCFWHGCRYHGTQPKSNAEFWISKIARNKARDREINRIYKEMGWRVLRLWEHHLKDTKSKRTETVLLSLSKGK